MALIQVFTSMKNLYHSLWEIMTISLTIMLFVIIGQ